jgi:hypothetical protein
MNICDALEQGTNQQKAIRIKDWPLNLAWYHGMDNVIRWWNDDPDSICCYKTGDEVNFCVADFLNNNFEIHPTIAYHGDLKV